MRLQTEKEAKGVHLATRAQLGASRNLQDKTTKMLFFKTKSLHALKVGVAHLWSCGW